LFSGIGGIDIGFVQAGFNIVWANEFNKEAAMTYRHNFKDSCLVEKNIKRVQAESIPDFDVLVAGFPCQPFSSAGMQKGF
jgi:DNA (cytosine-5)-methyltransferase 1